MYFTSKILKLYESEFSLAFSPSLFAIRKGRGWFVDIDLANPVRSGRKQPS
jgi:hypothetical protein